MKNWPPWIRRFCLVFFGRELWRFWRFWLSTQTTIPSSASAKRFEPILQDQLDLLSIRPCHEGCYPNLAKWVEVPDGMDRKVVGREIRGRVAIALMLERLRVLEWFRGGVRLRLWNLYFGKYQAVRNWSLSCCGY